jgi:hypothetical protein
LYGSFNTSIYLLSTVLHPYYKLAYIKLAWGGPVEQAAEIAAGNPNAKNWQAEARKIVEKTVRLIISNYNTMLNSTIKQMAEYYSTRPAVAARNITSDTDPSITISEFDKHRESLLSNDVEEGWVSELRRYIETMQRDIKKDADIVEWWQVSAHF